MKTNKNIIMGALIFIIGLGLYNLIVFISAGEFTNTLWACYIFTSIAFIAQLIVTISISNNANSSEESFLKLPQFIVTIWYIIIQLIVGIILMLAQPSSKVAIVIQAVIFAIYLFMIVSAIMGKEHSWSVDIKVKESINFIKTLTVDAKFVYEKETEAYRKNELKKLYESIRFSDPVTTTSEVKAVEEQIKAAYDKAITNMNDKTIEQLKQDITDTRDLLAKRNNLCKYSK